MRGGGRNKKEGGEDHVGEENGRYGREGEGRGRGRDEKDEK